MLFRYSFLLTHSVNTTFLRIYIQNSNKTKSSKKKSPIQVWNEHFVHYHWMAHVAIQHISFLLFSYATHLYNKGACRLFFPKKYNHVPSHTLTELICGTYFLHLNTRNPLTFHSQEQTLNKLCYLCGHLGMSHSTMGINQFPIYFS